MLVVLSFAFYANGAQAANNRSFSTLEQSQVLSGDFDAILQSGKLRILLPQDFSSSSYLPRKRSPLAEQQRIAEEFALSHGLVPELVIVKSFAELIPALVEGKGDIIINNLTINEQRRKKISFSVPVTHVVEQVLVRKGNDSISRVRDLDGKTIMVNRDSTFWHALLWLQKNKYPDMTVLAAPDHVKREQILDRLVAGDFDATILDSNLVEIFQGYRDDLQVAVNFSGQRDIGWGIRKDAPRLVNEINRFLQLEHMVDRSNEISVGDFGEIKKRRVLRVLLRNNAASYFLYRGELMGFEYELVREFADYHNLRLEVVVPPGPRELSTWLLEGKADMALGFLQVSPKLQRVGLAYTRPYHFARQHFVVHENDSAGQLSDLSHYKISVQRNGSYWDLLSRLQRQGAGFGLDAVEDNFETEQLIRKVASGEYQATMADEHMLDIELANSASVRSAFVLDQEVPHVIAIRARNSELQKALNDFIKRVYKGELYNVLYQKYFKSKRSIKKFAQERAVNTLAGSISPFDKLIKKYANLYGFDWRLIAAQMYQESGFDPRARSAAGARGLMQIMPRTANSLGFENVVRPDNGINAGVKYMDWLRDRFDKNLPISERLWFTLAAYNAGAGHVQDARSLAKRLGLDPDRWFDHTESAMLLLSQKKYASKARYGFVRGKEPVNYVREIKQRFEAYVDLDGAITGESRLFPEKLSALADPAS